MTRDMRLVLVHLGLSLLLVSGCKTPEKKAPPPAPEAPACEPELLGQASDAAIGVGDYDGYALRACDRPEHEGRHVVGLGDQWFEKSAPDSEGREQALAQMQKQLADKYLTNIASLQGGGVGKACTTAVETGEVVVYVSDWREVDNVVIIAANFLKERYLKEAISIVVRPKPCPQP